MTTNNILLKKRNGKKIISYFTVERDFKKILFLDILLVPIKPKM